MIFGPATAQAAGPQDFHCGLGMQQDIELYFGKTLRRSIVGGAFRRLYRKYRDNITEATISSDIVYNFPVHLCYLARGTTRITPARRERPYGEGRSVKWIMQTDRPCLMWKERSCLQKRGSLSSRMNGLSASD
jgi:hypothetical protein